MLDRLLAPALTAALTTVSCAGAPVQTPTAEAGSEPELEPDAAAHDRSAAADEPPARAEARAEAAVDDDAPPEPPERGPVAEALTRGFLARLTVHTRRDGTRVLSRRCREGPVPCRARVAHFAGLLAAAARRHELDPYLLGALALRESGLDPAAVNRSGAAGILQLHPRGVGRGMRFVVDAAYRARCQARVDACQAPIVERGAEALAQAIEDCGSLRSALGRYATGRCTTRARHIGHVLEERTRLRAASR